MKDNRAFVVTGLGAAILDAEMSVKTKCKVPRIPRRILWEEASEEMRNDPSVMWITNATILGQEKKYCFRRYTKEEKEELRKYQQQRLLDEFDYILNKYGWEYAEGFYHMRKYRFEEYNIEVNLKIPHCEYSKDNQCDMTCAFFNGRCCYD